jgi:isopentenyl diphosphate isomerase/L-lactate dehydrogenase-like FMN-dependent dehydrogenase
VTREEAAGAVEAGADAVYVSNHGGRAEAAGLGANILGDVVPIVIQLMLENAQGVWGDACYPVVG